MSKILEKYKSKTEELSAWDMFFIKSAGLLYLGTDPYDSVTMYWVMDFWQRMGIDMADEIIFNGTPYIKLYKWADHYDNLSDDGKVWFEDKIKNSLLDFIGGELHPIEAIFDNWWNS